MTDKTADMQIDNGKNDDEIFKNKRNRNEFLIFYIQSKFTDVVIS